MPERKTALTAELIKLVHLREQPFLHIQTAEADVVIPLEQRDPRSGQTTRQMLVDLLIAGCTLLATR